MGALVWLAAGRIISIAFFTLLFMAAFTSCAGGLAVVLAPIRDEWRVPKWAAASIGVLVVTLLGIPSALSFTPVGLAIGDKPFLDVMDQITGSGVVILAGILGAALIAWRIPTSSLLEAMNSGSNHRWIITIGRYLPLGAALLLATTYLL